MDLNSLRTFVAVAREGNLSRAADRVFLTQPALSRQMKNLQEQLNLTLFVRESRGMRLTAAGRQLLPTAEQALRAAAEFSAAAAGLSDDVAGRLRLGTILDPEFLRLGRLMETLVQRYPAMSYELSHGMSGQVARLVEDGQLDVAYSLGPPGLSELRERFHVVRLSQFSYRVVAPPGWGSRVTGKDWRALSSLAWIGTPPDSVHNRLLSDIFTARGLDQNVVAQVDLEPSMMDLVKSGVGLALARHSLALVATHAHDVVIVDSVSVDAEICIVCRPERTQEPTINAAMTAIEDVWTANY